MVAARGLRVKVRRVSVNRHQDLGGAGDESLTGAVLIVVPHSGHTPEVLPVRL